MSNGSGLKIAAPSLFERLLTPGRQRNLVAFFFAIFPGGVPVGAIFISMRYLLKSILRYAHLSHIYPTAFLAYILANILEEKRSINADERKRRKVASQESGDVTGWCAGNKTMYLFGFFPVLTLKEGEDVSAHHFYFRRPQSTINWAFKNSGISLPENPSVFEPGCGCGKNLYYFQDTVGATVEGVDVYEPAVEVAKHANIFGKAKFTHYDAVQNGLQYIADKSFDLVVIHSYLSHIEHLPQFQAHLDELVRIGRNILVFEILNTEILKILADRGFERLPHPKMVMALKERNHDADKRRVV